MGGHHDVTTVRKNVYIEGIANFRDQMHLDFPRNLRRGKLLSFAFVVVAFPAFLYQTAAYGQHYRETQQQQLQQFLQKQQPKQDEE